MKIRLLVLLVLAVLGTQSFAGVREVVLVPKIWIWEADPRNVNNPNKFPIVGVFCDVAGVPFWYLAFLLDGSESSKEFLARLTDAEKTGRQVKIVYDDSFLYSVPSINNFDWSNTGYFDAARIRGLKEIW